MNIPVFGKDDILDHFYFDDMTAGLRVHVGSCCRSTSCLVCVQGSESGEGRKEKFYLTTHSTHFIYGYMASDIMVKDHSDSKRGNPLLPHGLLFPINSKGSFICTIPLTE